MDCLGAQGNGVPFPEPPETVKAISKAKDRRAALERLYPGGSFGLFPYEPETLIERGERGTSSLVAGRELGDGPIPDLSE